MSFFVPHRLSSSNAVFTSCYVHVFVYLGICHETEVMSTHLFIWQSINIQKEKVLNSEGNILQNCLKCKYTEFRKITEDIGKRSLQIDEARNWMVQNVWRCVSYHWEMIKKIDCGNATFLQSMGLLLAYYTH